MIILKISSILLIILSLSSYDTIRDYDFGPYHLQDLKNKEEYIRQMHSIMNSYRGEREGRMVMVTDSMVNTKYRTWKRNADIINSLLALPKGLNDAGR